MNMELSKEDQQKTKAKMVLRSPARDARSMANDKIMAARASNKQVQRKRKRKKKKELKQKK